jgi:hypothetical protein
MNAPAYYPRPGSLAAQVVYFFRANAGEELTLDDITAKFDASRGNIHTQLRPAVEVGLLQRDRNADGEYIYTAGARIDVISAAGDTPAQPAPRARKTARFASPRHQVDLGALVVEKGVPLPEQRAKRASKWTPIFAKLAEVGDSIAIPPEICNALRAEAIKRAKAGQGHYRVLLTDGGGARIWRVDAPASKPAPAQSADAPKTPWRALDAPKARAKAVPA